MSELEPWRLRLEAGEPQARYLSGEWEAKTIADYAGEMHAADPETPVIIVGEQVHTVSELLDRATALARGLRSLGLDHGDTVSFQLPNWIETAVIDLACALGGFIVNPIVTIYRHSELEFILADARSKAMFIPEIFRDVDYPAMIGALRERLPLLEHVVVTRGASGQGLSYDAVIARGRASVIALTPALPDETKQVIYTSGTTGPAKGVLYSHAQARRTLLNSFVRWKLERGAKFLIGSPVAHVSGFSYGIDMAFYLGTVAVLMERWEGERAVELIDRHGIDVMLGATPFLTELLAAAEKAGSRLPSLRIFFCGGAAVPPDLIRRANAAFENCKTFRVFGSSECPMITQGTPEDAEKSATTDGRIYDYQVKVVDDDGRSLPPDTDGELLARGPAMFRGYTDPRATREAFDADGFFRTGDIGRVGADGSLTVTGRKKDLIIRGGENLSAKEIEDAIHRHPGIREVSIVSMPHDRLGEGVCAYALAADNPPDVDALKAFLKAAGLAPQKWPERLIYVEDLPRTASGKVQKHILRQRVAELVKAEKAARVAAMGV